MLILVITLKTMQQNKAYNNFVKASELNITRLSNLQYLSGEDAKKIYLQEVRGANSKLAEPQYLRKAPKRNHNVTKEVSSILDLYMAAQNNDVEIIRDTITHNPNLLNITDEYGWSLLMVACQANSIDTVKELLKLGADVNIRDKAGNSARSLVIKNKNIALVNLLLSTQEINKKPELLLKQVKTKSKESFICDICNNQSYPDKDAHLSSTEHNLNASKAKKPKASFKIPETNKGFQLMLKGGWNKEAGLGRDGQGKVYPIRTEQKLDKKGLGSKKRKIDNEQDTNQKSNIKDSYNKDHNRNRRLEIEFRRQFY